MSRARRRGFLHLNANLYNLGNHEAAWRLPEQAPLSSTELSHWLHLARLAEQGRFDALFIGDVQTLPDGAEHHPGEALDPLVTISAMAVVTEHVGLIATASTSYNEPFNLARRFASLDRISGGRAAWNVVTSGGLLEAQNYGHDTLPPHAERYARAAEALDVVLALWGSWDDGALIGDQVSGHYLDPARVHPIEHRGERFSVRGPLNVPPSPQGRPLIVQAGASDAGRDLASKYADVVFTAQTSLDEAIAFRDDIHARAVAHGREPGAVKVLPGVMTVVADTTARAQARVEALDDLIVGDHALGQLAEYLQVDRSLLVLDEPLPQVALVGGGRIQAHQSRYALITELAEREALTVRQLLRRVGGGRGHRTVAGTAEQVADDLQAWFEAGAADGFNVMPPALPGDLAAFVTHVVPVLQDRGLLRRAYETTTLRGHYGLPSPR